MKTVADDMWLADLCIKKKNHVKSLPETVDLASVASLSFNCHCVATLRRHSYPSPGWLLMKLI